MTDSTRILLNPMEITCVILGTGSLSSGSFIVCNSDPRMSTNLNTRATWPLENCGWGFNGPPADRVHSEPGSTMIYGASQRAGEVNFLDYQRARTRLAGKIHAGQSTCASFYNFA